MSRKRPLVLLPATPEQERPQKRRKLSEIFRIPMASSSSNAMAVDTQVVGTKSYASLRGPRKFIGSRGRRGRKLNKRQISQVKRSLQKELKFIFGSTASTAVSSTPALTNNFIIPQGVTDQERVGDQIEWCGTFEYNLQIVNAQGATGDAYNNVRFIVFQWYPGLITGNPIASSILLNGPSAGIDVYSVYNHDNRQMYTIMFDEVFTTCGSNNTATNPPQSNVTTGIRRIRIPSKGIHKMTQYVGGTTQGTNTIWSLVVSDSALATHPTIAYSAKAFFRDI